MLATIFWTACLAITWNWLEPNDKPPYPNKSSLYIYLIHMVCCLSQYGLFATSCLGKHLLHQVTILKHLHWFLKPTNILWKCSIRMCKCHLTIVLRVFFYVICKKFAFLQILLCTPLFTFFHGDNQSSF